MKSSLSSTSASRLAASAKVARHPDPEALDRDRIGIEADGFADQVSRPGDQD